MSGVGNISRRDFLRGAAAAGICGGLAFSQARGDTGRSPVFRIDQCPPHDYKLRHVGVDSLLSLLAANNIKFYQAATPHPWGGPAGIIAKNDVVLIKVNCQWKCRGATNTDVVRGVIQRILEHPDGFSGEVVIIENTQGVGAFSGLQNPWGSYNNYPEVNGGIHVNAEVESVVTVDYLVNFVFKGKPVSSFLLDTIRANVGTKGVGLSDHTRQGYRTVAPPAGSASMKAVSYPCFNTAGGSRIELKQGRWTGSGYAQNVKLINIPVLKDHGGTGMTGALKHMYGVLAMGDGVAYRDRHYAEAGSQCGKMWSLVRIPDLNILDCIWVSHEALIGYPVSATRRCNTLLAALDPVALDYYASKHVLLPLGGAQAAGHDPDATPELINFLKGAQDFINANGGIHGAPARQGDANIQVLARAAGAASAGPAWREYG